MKRSPTDRCGFTWESEASEESDENCCYRESWREYDRCIWHAKTDFGVEKPVEELHAALTDSRTPAVNGGDSGPASGRAPLLDGARVSTVCDERTLSFHGCSLRDANFRGDFSDCTFAEADLSGANFGGTDLSGADFRGADAPDSHLKEANCRGARLLQTDLSGANLTNVDLTDSNLAMANVANAELVGAELTDAHLASADFSAVNLTNAVLTRANLFSTTLTDARIHGTVLVNAQIDSDTTFAGEGDSWPRCAYDPKNRRVENSSRNVLSKAANAYLAIERLARDNSLPKLQSRMFVRRQDMQTEMHKERSEWVDYLFAQVSRGFLLYGESYGRILLWGAAVIGLFAVLYPLGGWIQPVGPQGELGTPITWERIGNEPVLLWRSIYYSTVTFTALGFGDFRPVGILGQALTVLETGVGAVLMALLVFVLGRRAAR